MITKITPLSQQQLNSFRTLGSTMGSLATISMPGTYPAQLKDCGINERGTARNQLVGYVMTQPSGSQLALETVFFDLKDNKDNGDLYIINFQSKTLTSHLSRVGYMD